MFGIFKKAKPNAAATISSAIRTIHDYGAYLERHPFAFEIVDEMELPHSKKEILNAICIALLVEPNVTAREGLITSALSLANFQPGIGKEPLHPLGVNISKSESERLDGHELAKRILSNPDGKARYDLLRPVVEREIVEIGERVKAANQVFNQKR